MKQFLVLRVPAAMSGGKRNEPVRRDGFGANPTVVAELDTREEAAAEIGKLSFRDDRHHYYGLELVLDGDPESRNARAIKFPVKLPRRSEG